MTAVAMPYAGNRSPLDAEVAARAAGGLKWVIADALTLTKRNLIAYTRIPEAAFFSSVQPIMFVLLFRYVFGGAINGGSAGSYVEFLLPGIFVQTVSFGSIGTAIGLAEDLQKGLIERFRALPMSRSAVLAGRTLADFVRNIAVMILMLAVGYAVGFRLHGPVLHIAAGIGLVLLFAYALSWGFAYVGLAARNSETAQLMAFPVLFPLTFASSAFVPTQTMPGWLQAWAAHQPVSQVCNAVRGLLIDRPIGTSGWQSLAWGFGALVVLSTLAVRKYRKTA